MNSARTVLYNRSHRLRRQGAVVALLGLVVTILGVFIPVAAAPTQNRAYVGFPDVTTNGFGGSDSWGGSFGLYTGHDQTGEFFAAYCIDRGQNYPQGTDPNFSDANSGFSSVGDVPAARGVPAATREALSYALWRYGNTTDPTTAGAMFIISHVMSGDPTFGSNSVADTTLGAGWPNPTAVKNRALQIEQEAYAKRGPWTLNTNITHTSGNQFQVTVDLTGPAGAIAGEPVAVNVQNGSGGGTLTTNANGRISFTTTAVNVANPVVVTASKAQVPARQNYNVLQGQAGTQRVITGGPNGAPISDSDSAVVPFGSARIVKVTTNPNYQSGQGAQFQVRRGGADGTVVGTLTVGANGMSNILDDLTPGTYTVIETVAPEGQVLDPTPQTVTVAAGPVVTVNRTNEVLTEASIELVKEDADTGELLAGATFRVDYDSDNNGTFETLIGTYTTDTTPVVVDNLRVGAYRVTETAPPPGYTLPAPNQRSVVLQLTYGSHSTTNDNVLTAVATHRNREPVIRTQVIDPDVDDDPNTFGVDERHRNNFLFGDRIADEVIIENVAVDISGTVTVELFGPFAADEPMECSAENLVGVETFTTTGSGVFTSPSFKPATPGIYTFVATFNGEDGSAATHDCGVATETVTVEQPRVATQTIDPTVDDDPDTDHDEPAQHLFNVGDQFADRVLVEGVGPTQTGVLTAELFGPFAADEPMECSAENLVHTETWEFTGSGVTTSPPFTVDTAGVYTFVETWTETPAPENGDPVTATHECGLSEETVQIVTVTTVASAQTSLVGSPVVDTVRVDGLLADTTGELHVAAYGPFTSQDCAFTNDTDDAPNIDGGCVDAPEDVTGIPSGMVCAADTLAWETTFEVDGPGPHVSPAFVPDVAGVYTFVATWTETVHDDIRTPFVVTHPCGLTSETVVMHPLIETVVSAQRVTAGDDVFDIGTLTGVPDTTTGVASFELYGPFETFDDVECSDRTFVADGSTSTVGSGEFRSPAFTVDEPGVYTFVASWVSDDELLNAAHECGLAAESFTVFAPTGGGGAGGGGGGETTGLPVTGSNTWTVTAAGAVTLLAGVLMVVEGRRRMRFAVTG